MPRVTETPRHVSTHHLPPRSAPHRGRLGLTSGRLCWRPAPRHPASMSEPRSSRPPWALLSYYSHSSGCCRGFQTSKRTFTLPLSLSRAYTLSPLTLSSLSSSPRLPPFSPWLPSSCVCLIALSEEQSGVVCFTWRLVAARVSQSKQKMRHAEGKGELSASRVNCASCHRLQKERKKNPTK